jgi:hypothetical protein
MGIDPAVTRSMGTRESASGLTYAHELVGRLRASKLLPIRQTDELVATVHVMGVWPTRPIPDFSRQ